MFYDFGSLGRYFIFLFIFFRGDLLVNILWFSLFFSTVDCCLNIRFCILLRNYYLLIDFNTNTLKSNWIMFVFNIPIFSCFLTSICKDPRTTAVCDQYNFLIKRLIPLAKKWTVTLTKAGRFTNHQLFRCNEFDFIFLSGALSLSSLP